MNIVLDNNTVDLIDEDYDVAIRIGTLKTAPCGRAN
ncbi:MAG: hypothetical protein ACI9BH_000944 [Paracoccaceae bacterium]|jgi:hypothetical protein